MDDAFLRDFFGLPAKAKLGVALRDHFAGQAFAAIIGTLNGPVTHEEAPGDFRRYATAAYAMADALIAARK